MSPFFQRYFLPKSSPTTPNHPIPNPSNRKQYRAIGLIRAKYQMSPEKINRGYLVDVEGNIIRVVILGKVISLIRKHLDLTKEYLWVVYPRTQVETGELHLQVVGVWQPENVPNPPLNLPDRWFSVRGEVVRCDRRKQQIIIKIRQKPKQQGEKPRFFKLQLQGILSDKPEKHFWDLEVYLDQDKLVIQRATDLGLLPQYEKTKPILKTAKPRRSYKN